MKFTQAIRMAFSAIFSSKMRSFLTTLGIIIGVFSVTLLVSIVQAATGGITSQLNALGGDVLTVSVSAPSTTNLTLQDLEALQGTGGIQYITPYTQSGNQTVKAPGNVSMSQVTVMGTTPNYQQVRSVVLTDGQFLCDLDVENRFPNAVIGATVAQTLYGSTDPVGDTVNISGRPFTVVGVMKADGGSTMNSNDSRIIIAYTLLQRMNGSSTISSFYATSGAKGSATEATQTLNDFLLGKTGSTDYFSVFNQADILSTISSVTGTLSMVLGGIAGISLVVGGIGIMNIMLVSVTERTREIGIRKAIGAQKLDIMTQFIVEAVSISVLGGLIGLGLGYVVIHFIGPAIVAASGTTNMTLSMSPSIGLLAILFSIAIGVVFGSFPAYKAARLLPIDALRYE